MTHLPDHREQWREWATSKIEWPDPAWLANIISSKRATVETSTSGQYFTLCDAEGRKEIVIHRVTPGNAGKHSCYIFVLGFPELPLPVQPRLFDL